VALWILQRLGVPVASTTSTHTAAGQIKVNLYDVSLSITDPSQVGSPMLTLPDLVGM
jgi:hypothetical protein